MFTYKIHIGITNSNTDSEFFIFFIFSFPSFQLSLKINTALGAKGKTRAQGATSVNELVPIGNFFQTQIAIELDCKGGTEINGPAPVLKAGELWSSRWCGE